MIYTPVIGIVLRGIPEDLAGAASGALLTATQIATILNVAATGSIFMAILGTYAGRSGYDRAFSGTLLWLCVLAVLTIVLLLGLSAAQRRSSVSNTEGTGPKAEAP